MNAGYQYYKGYFLNLDFINLKGDANKESIKRRNRQLLDYKLPNLNEREEFNQFSRFRLRTTNPGLLMGTGYTHEIGVEGELKLGFSFDHSSGIPFIPGSSIKGMIREFFPKFTTHITGEKRYFPESLTANDIQKAKIYFLREKLALTEIPENLSEEKYFHQLELYLFEGVDPLKKDAKDCFIARNLVVSFMDAFPVNSGKKVFQDDSLAPHKGIFEDPVPLPFLKVGAGIEFDFMFSIPEIPNFFGLKIDNNDAKELIKNLFKEILLQSGIGAKTNVGYGRLEEDKKETIKSGQHVFIPENIIKAERFRNNEKYKGRITGIIQDEKGDFFEIKFVSVERVKKESIEYHNTVYKRMNNIRDTVSIGDEVTIEVKADYTKNIRPKFVFSVTKVTKE